MIPDFSKKTVETLAKRAGFICSNPACRKATVGPNAEQSKSTTIGEAAHIKGARPNAPRYDRNMTDVGRAEVTNGIWLCRNCHKIIDADPQRHSSALLFAWREEHENYATNLLGNRSDQIEDNLRNETLKQFNGYPPIIRRLAFDLPDCWEYRLTAELLRYFNKQHLRKLRDLEDGLYTLPLDHIPEELALNWVQERTNEMEQLIGPLGKLLDRLCASWGEPGEPGDMDEIHRYCRLIGDSLARIAAHEEKARFARLPEAFELVQNLLTNILGEQAQKFAAIPQVLDDALDEAARREEEGNEEPVTISHTIVIDLPEGWVEEITRQTKIAVHQVYYE